MQPLRQPAAEARGSLSPRERVGRDPSGCQFDTRRPPPSVSRSWQA